MKQSKQELIDLLAIFLNQEYKYWIDSIGEPKTKQIIFDILSHWSADNPNDKSMKEAKEVITIILDQVKTKGKNPSLQV